VDALVARCVEGLRAVGGIEAIALGGSHARGVARPDSDVDLGLYYSEAAPPDLGALRRLAADLNGTPDPVVTELYGWGRWVNGGAWLTIGGQRLDFLYRNLDQVERVIADCEAGEVTNDFWQQAPYGFFSYIYLGELAACRPLHDPGGVLAALKERVAVYPEPLRRQVVQGQLWSAVFTLENAHKLAARGDVYSTVGCLTRAAASLTQALFALNRTYFVSDKDALIAIDGFAVRPERYGARMAALLGAAGTTPSALEASVAAAEALCGEAVALAGDLYRSRY
jgi:hypothetical protein